MIPMVCCDVCERWVHCVCDGIRYILTYWIPFLLMWWKVVLRFHFLTLFLPWKFFVMLHSLAAVYICTGNYQDILNTIFWEVLLEFNPHLFFPVAILNIICLLMLWWYYSSDVLLVYCNIIRLLWQYVNLVFSAPSRSPSC